MPESKINHQRRCLNVFMFTHQGSECKTCRDPITVPHQKQNHSFMSTRSSRYKDTLDILGNEYHSHLTMNSSEHSGKAQRSGWNQTMADSYDQLQGCDWYHRSKCSLSRHILSQYEGSYEEETLEIKYKENFFPQWKHIQTNKKQGKQSQCGNINDWKIYFKRSHV